MKKTNKNFTPAPQKIPNKVPLSFAPKRQIKKKSLALVSILLFLLAAILMVTHRPQNFNPPSAQAKQVSPYLTNKLLPVFYNNIQKQQLFELEIPETGLNEIIGHLSWPKQFNDLTVNIPQVFLVNDEITLMAALGSDSAELLLTTSLRPIIGSDGLLMLYIEKVKIGAMTITPIAKFIANKIYLDQLEKNQLKNNDIKLKIIASLFADTAFDPVFEFDDNRFRIQKITIESGKVILKIQPLAN